MSRIRTRVLLMVFLAMVALTGVVTTTTAVFADDGIILPDPGYPWGF